MEVPLSFGPAVELEAFDAIRTRMALEFCKWDSQVGDTSTLFRQPLFISGETWCELQGLAEALTAELMLAEGELLQRPDLHPLLGLPTRLQSVLRARHDTTPGLVRVMRFDFHHTTDGWRISEVNSDVPGGYTESSRFTRLMSHQFPGTRSPGDPASEFVNAVNYAVGEHGCVALLSAAGFLEDQQVTSFLSSEVQAKGLVPALIHAPTQLTWKSGHANAIVRGELMPVDGIMRFYQGEWLAELSANCGWKWLLFGGRTPVTNPVASLLTESKRFALACRHLSTKMPTWQSLLPECRDPREVSWKVTDSWMVKAAFSNTGDEVHTSDLMNRGAWRGLARRISKHPGTWVVQRRFQPIPVSSDVGPLQICLGVFTVDGRAAGIYARGSAKLVIDYAAMDIAALVYEGANA